MNYLFKKIIEQNQKERELEVCPQQNELRFNISSLLSPSMYVLSTDDLRGFPTGCSGFQQLTHRPSLVSLLINRRLAAIAAV